MVIVVIGILVILGFIVSLALLAILVYSWCS